jgi:hypothetical protein
MRVASSPFRFFISLFLTVSSVSMAATLRIELSTHQVSEAAGADAVRASIEIDAPRETDLPLRLIVSDPLKIGLPGPIVIEAGNTNTEVGLDVVNDWEVDGTSDVTLTASADGFEDAVATLAVTDDDTAETRALGGKFFGELPAGVYHVKSDLVVDEGYALVIAPSATLYFDDQTGLIVRGSLIATNSNRSGIRFLSSSAQPEPGSWRGIAINNSSDTEARLEGVEVSHAEIGIAFTQTPRNPRPFLSKAPTCMTVCWTE